MVTASEWVSKACKFAAKRTVLLTGFEGFSRGKRNASWEAIKGVGHPSFRVVIAKIDLDKSVSKQIRKLVEEHDPEAVFSFGQGVRDEFMIEALAQRPDRLKRGPEEVGSDPGLAQGMEEALSGEFPVEVSVEAGNKECEEALWELSSLQTDKGFDSLFVHVPPGKDASGFVRAFLDAYAGQA